MKNHIYFLLNSNYKYLKGHQDKSVSYLNSQKPEFSKINQIEVNFIQELTKVYEKYYGNKREYKIPSHLIDANESDKTNYALLLMELNNRCSKWINEHVEINSFIHWPIFIDYFNYLIQLENKFMTNPTSAKQYNARK